MTFWLFVLAAFWISEVGRLADRQTRTDATVRALQERARRGDWP